MKFENGYYINNIPLIENNGVMDFLCGLDLHEKGST